MEEGTRKQLHSAGQLLLFKKSVYYTAKKKHLLFWQLHLSPELQLLTRIVPCGSQHNTHGVQEQLKLLQGLVLTVMLTAVLIGTYLSGYPGCRQIGETVVTILERFALVLKTNCIRQPKGQLPSSSYNQNTLTSLRVSVRESPVCTTKA